MCSFVFYKLSFPLQTSPSYLAKLVFAMPQTKTTKFMESVIFTLYNFGANQREEFLLLKLFRTALEEEVNSKVGGKICVLLLYSSLFTFQSGAPRL